jgi:hypothetical protein
MVAPPSGQVGGVLADERTCHLDAAYDGKPARQALAEWGFAAQIPRLGIPAPPPSVALSGASRRP